MRTLMRAGNLGITPPLAFRPGEMEGRGWASKQCYIMYMQPICSLQTNGHSIQMVPYDKYPAPVPAGLQLASSFFLGGSMPEPWPLSASSYKAPPPSEAIESGVVRRGMREQTACSEESGSQH